MTQDKTMDDLLPCPKCKSKKIDQYSEWCTMSSAEIICDDCDFNVCEITLDKALQTWNSIKDWKAFSIAEVNKHLGYAENRVKKYQKELAELKGDQCHECKCTGKVSAALTADDPVKRQLVDAAKEFVRRVEAGEIRSKKSHAAFKEALAAAEREQS